MSEVEEVVVWEGGRRTLASDPVFGPVVREVGPVTVPARAGGPFAYLARAVVYQQLAGAAARTIHGRVVDVLGGPPSPERLARASDEALRAAGLSRGKLKALRDLADKVASGEVVLDDLDDQPDDEVERRLTRVWGIGAWTAHMFLMFHLHRPDVWPVGDLGVRQGFARLHGLDDPVPARDMVGRGDAYRPFRSAAAWYCWRALEIEVP